MRVRTVWFGQQTLNRMYDDIFIRGDVNHTDCYDL